MSFHPRVGLTNMASGRTLTIIAILAGIALGTLLLTKQKKSHVTETSNAEEQSQRPSPAPKRIHAPRAVTPASKPETTGERLARLFSQESVTDEFRLTESEIATYLAENRTNAFSLIAAFHASNDLEYLKLAATSFPDDPTVISKVLAHDLYPEQRQQWIEAMKQHAPNNSFPYLLTAQELMNKGDANGAIEQINAARNMRYNDYTRESMVGLEEAYLSAGRSVAEAKALGSASVHLPQLAPIKKLGSQMADMAVKYRDAGDTASQQTLLEATWQLGHQFRESNQESTLLHGLVGLAVENLALNRWHENSAAPFLDRPVDDLQAENRTFRTGVRADVELNKNWLPHASENEIIQYYDRLRTFGELNALQWLRQRQQE